MSSGVVVSSSPINDTMYPIEAVSAADRLMELKHENQTDIWPVIDGVLELWKTQRPKEWESTIYEIKQEREAQGTKHGTKKAPSGYTSQLRRKLDIPMFVERAIRFLYSPEELPMDKAFWQEFWRKYPYFRVSETE